MNPSTKPPKDERPPFKMDLDAHRRMIEANAKPPLQQAQPKKRRYRRTSATESANRASRIDWLLPGIVPAHGITLVVGDTGTGKSTLVHSLLDDLLIQTGKLALWFGVEEREIYDLRNRALRHRRPGQPKLELIEPEPNQPNPAKFIATVVKETEEDTGDRVELIVVDPIRDVMMAAPGLEANNSNASVRDALTSLLALDIPVIGISHFSKAQGSLLQRVMGATDWVAVPRVVLGMVKMKNDDIRLGRLVNNVGPSGGVWAPRIVLQEIEDRYGRKTEVALAEMPAEPIDAKAHIQAIHDAEQKKSGEVVDKEAALLAFVEDNGGQVTGDELNRWMDEDGRFESKETRTKYRRRLLRGKRDSADKRRFNYVLR